MSNQTMKLRPWEEFTGILQCVNVKADEGVMIASFPQGNKILVPLIPHLRDEFEKRIGQRISLLHTDIADKNYLILQEG